MVSSEVNTSFIVLTYNRADALLQVLNGLAQQCQPGHEVIIADDGSSDAATAAWMSELPTFSCSVKHVWHPDVGFTASRARNLGAISSRGKYLVFLDGDCVPNPRFVQAHAQLAEVGWFVNGSRVLLSEQLTEKVLRNDVAISDAKFSDWMKWRLAGDANKLSHLLHWPTAPRRRQLRFRWKGIRSCNFALWRDDFFKVNGFDETFEGWGHEDADLVLRLHNAGLARKNGIFGTEVYHLWHREANRHAESRNYQRVLNCLQTGKILAAKGVNDDLHVFEPVITLLN